MDVAIERRTAVVDPSLEHFPPLLQRIYAARHIQTPLDIEHQLIQLLPYDDMLNIAAAVQRLRVALERAERIVIVGDFDVDGATSTTVAVLALRAMGAQHVSYLVPNRFEYGYGLSPEIVDVAAKQQPDLIITVDNGISSHAGVERARSLGIDVLITDHHLQGETIPQDCVIVNPNLIGDVFPSKALAGVGVIFYVMLALRAECQRCGWFEKQGLTSPKMSQYLDLVALGTVADLVPLDKNNRILVQQGLSRIRQQNVRPGLLALIEVSKRNAKQLLTSDFGFGIAPRLNAAGRLEDMSLGIECLLSEEIEHARAMAQQLDHLNVERKAIEQQMKQQALSLVADLALDEVVATGVCLFEDTWHQGVVGLVASRIKDQLHRPTIAFAKVGDGTLKGSGRSIPGLNLRDVLQRIDSLHPGLITKYGGHAMAAGLSIAQDSLSQFSQCFNDAVSEIADADIFNKKWWTDGELSVADFTLDTAHVLRDGGPWGQAFPEPLFDGVFDVLDQRLVGGHHLKLTLRHPDGNYPVDAIFFNVDVNQWPNYDCEQVRIIYRLDINEFRNKKSLQLMVEKLWLMAG